jgi:predicted HicB family RNase H-like nuclease
LFSPQKNARFHVDHVIIGEAKIDEKRREQLRLAQSRRREKRRESGKVMLEIPISPELRNELRRMAEGEGIGMWELVERILKNSLTKEKGWVKK